MDVDRYIWVHRPTWDRLAALSARGGARGRSLSPDELDELVYLYQQVSGHLSHARGHFHDPALTATLTRLVADANAAVYGSRGNARAALRRFVRETFPRTVWDMRWMIVVAAALTLLPAAAVGTWLANSDAALDASAPAEVRDAYVQTDFEDYYSSKPAAQFAAEVTFNNIRVAFTAFAAGIVVCAGAAYILASNGANVGFAVGLFYAAGQPGRFWGLILPHGLLELTAVIVAGGAGLALGWSVIAPGDRTRVESLARQGRASVTVVLGLVAAFVVAGLIEGFVTGSGLPTVVRVGAGAVVWAASIFYVVRFGRITSHERDGSSGTVAVA